MKNHIKSTPEGNYMLDVNSNVTHDVLTSKMLSSVCAQEKVEKWWQTNPSVKSIQHFKWAGT